ncbi:MAG: methyltransferase domain-containing protein [Candidatus Eremiobacteraeota bacterium]|nr:methyltransferase domain-containing protein [Candidatus Eremiobacteraeota bacterium]
MREAPHSPEHADTIAAAHPLARALIERLRPERGARILEIGTGSGRNLRALQAAGLSVTSIDDARAACRDGIDAAGDGFTAGLSTHALLHGDSNSLTVTMHSIALALRSGGYLYASFGSSRDPRFGRGDRIDEFTFAPTEGDERGVSHVYYDEQRLRALLEPYFEVESLEEHAVDRIAGSWAHREEPLSGAIHWFAVARRR